MQEIEITDLWEAATSVRNVEQYKRWIAKEVRRVLPHGAFACGHGRVHSAGVSMDYVVTVDYPFDSRVITNQQSIGFLGGQK